MTEALSGVIGAVWTWHPFNDTFKMLFPMHQGLFMYPTGAQGWVVPIPTNTGTSKIIGRVSATISRPDGKVVNAIPYISAYSNNEGEIEPNLSLPNVQLYWEQPIRGSYTATITFEGKLKAGDAWRVLDTWTGIVIIAEDNLGGTIEEILVSYPGLPEAILVTPRSTIRIPKDVNVSIVVKWKNELSISMRGRIKGEITYPSGTRYKRQFEHIASPNDTDRVYFDWDISQSGNYRVGFRLFDCSNGWYLSEKQFSLSTYDTPTPGITGNIEELFNTSGDTPIAIEPSSTISALSNQDFRVMVGWKNTCNQPYIGNIKAGLGYPDGNIDYLEMSQNGEPDVLNHLSFQWRLTNIGEYSVGIGLFNLETGARLDVKAFLISVSQGPMGITEIMTLGMAVVMMGMIINSMKG